jgi:hypothetical protein
MTDSEGLELLRIATMALKKMRKKLIEGSR